MSDPSSSGAQPLGPPPGSTSTQPLGPPPVLPSTTAGTTGNPVQPPSASTSTSASSNQPAQAANAPALPAQHDGSQKAILDHVIQNVLISHPNSTNREIYLWSAQNSIQSLGEIMMLSMTEIITAPYFQYPPEWRDGDQIPQAIPLSRGKAVVLANLKHWVDYIHWKNGNKALTNEQWFALTASDHQDYMVYHHNSFVQGGTSTISTPRTIQTHLKDPLSDFKRSIKKDRGHLPQADQRGRL